MHMYIHCSTIYNNKEVGPTQMPLTIDWTRKTWHIYTMEYYAVIKKVEFMSFVGT